MIQDSEWLKVESLDLEAQGVAHKEDGKVVFIEGALPGEEVQVSVGRKKNNWEQGSLTALRKESSQRVTPGCPHFGLHGGACGGCKMQHLHASAQVAVKQRVVEDNLWHLGKVKPETLLRPIEGPTWGYRYRARFSVRYVLKKEQVLIGFHERKSRYVADMQVCKVVPQRVSDLLMPLRAMIASMEERDRLPQIELAMGDAVIALVLRNLNPLPEGDKAKLRAFAAEHDVQWWLQPKGPDTVHLLDEGGAELSYSLPEFGVVMPFKPTDFTQVNPHINSVLVGRALRLLDVRPDERVIDWFCGLGNFTLPLATKAREVVGIEGSETLVQRSRENARRNGLAEKTSFEARNLFEMTPALLAADGVADKWLVDPPRDGAFALAKAVADIAQDPSLAPGWQPPKRIVYVSCNPSTLARDAGLLVNLAGYSCTAASAVNMFPHTSHVESIAVFELDSGK
ncbi:23S rRNA (uracil(1939)-C(5))-methyltransferase RlmD [Paucibacter sp. KBW04]|uniref:23S rRNA (uracil(1939)-C(5))-methyltransferase RlmD n=1 Tax=Paucibacter sp. KBW04 TaxID=2153361 RepID=UPI000F5620AE|nr:23S rRNA (uracil(1939)-C(5))-methyltransferase RlmD [Paucibacter sp. KBW04]RQO55361.1 23S rRNA (uracil(1939)-C(5))-methyltransferase RlmD [Paucibacter sp. KBW04]